MTQTYHHVIVQHVLLIIFSLSGRLPSIMTAMHVDPMKVLR